MSKNAKGDKGEAPVKAPAAEGILGTDVLPSDKELFNLPDEFLIYLKLRDMLWSLLQLNSRSQ